MNHDVVNQRFRNDINGLRAIAVISVVLYHFGFGLFKGGFVGVDIFFVISGYLMTGIIIKGLEEGNFNLLNFYLNRIKRIVPMLVIVGVILIIIGWFYLPDSNIKILSTHILTSILFISNIKYWREAGYFDASSHEKWLLHTWSLSVEWQFYLILPILIMFTWKMLGPKWVKYTLTAIGLLSLITAIACSHRWSVASFFLLPTRMWEMIAGGTVWWLSRHTKLSSKQQLVLDVTGISLILVSIFTFTPSMAWPGLFTLTPVIGTMLIIYSGNKNTILASNRFTLAIGLRSYSIYLFHWPVIVALTYLNLQNNHYYIIASLVFIYIISDISYRTVEVGFKNKLSEIGKSNLLCLYFITTVLISGVCVLLIKQTFDRGVKERAEILADYTKIQTSHIMPSRDNGSCFNDLNSKEDPKISESEVVCNFGKKALPVSTGLSFGDSFSGQYDPFIEKIAQKMNFDMDYVSTNWCFPALNDAFNGPTNGPAFKQCLINREYYKNNISKYKFVILSAAWSNLTDEKYKNQIIESINYAISKGVRVYVMPSPIQYDNNVFANFMTAGFNNLPFNISNASRKRDVDAIKMHQIFSAMAKKGSIIFISREDVFKDEETYTKYGLQVPYSLDGYHISKESSEVLGDNFIMSGAYKKYFKKI